MQGLGSSIPDFHTPSSQPQQQHQHQQQQQQQHQQQQQQQQQQPPNFFHQDVGQGCGQMNNFGLGNMGLPGQNTMSSGNNKIPDIILTGSMQFALDLNNNNNFEHLYSAQIK
jgi:hypothetical protein